MRITKTPIEARIDELIATSHCSAIDFSNADCRSKFRNYEFDFKMDESTLRLLEHAFQALDMSSTTLCRIERITKAIMSLDNVTQAKPQHIAEAIQYVHRKI